MMVEAEADEVPEADMLEAIMFGHEEIKRIVGTIDKLVEAAGQPITAFLDSGSQVTIANQTLRNAALQARPDLGGRLIHSELLSATGQRAAADFGPLPDLRIGGQRLERPMVAFADLHIFELWDLQAQPTLLVGVDVLRRFDQVAFDFGKKLITFWPSRSPPRPRTPIIR